MSILKIVFVDDNGSAHEMHFHSGGEDNDSRVVQRIESRVNELQQYLGVIMAKVKDVEDLLDQVNTATNGIAARVQNEENMIAQLKAQIAAGTPVSQEQLDSIAARLSTVKEQLNTLASDPNNPVPAVPPVVENPPVPGTVG